MASSLSNLVNNFSDRIHKIKCKYDTMTKNVKFAELNINIATAFIDFKDDLIEYNFVTKIINESLMKS